MSQVYPAAGIISDASKDGGLKEDGGTEAPRALPPEAARAVAGLLGEGRVVVHRPCFALAFGGAACGLLLSQFWFWTSTPTVRDRAGGWFWKPQREITEETGLSRAETETARRRLCALGFCRKSGAASPPRCISGWTEMSFSAAYGIIFKPMPAPGLRRSRRLDC